jgi:hypothetical protein
MAGTKPGHDEKSDFQPAVEKHYDMNRSIFSSRAIFAP